MVKRVTLMMPDSTHKKVRAVQAKMITEVDYNVSFSSVVDMLLVEALKRK